MVSTSDVQSMRIPSDTAHVASMRAFVGAIGRHSGCSEGTIEDLRLAVTEACGQALGQDAPPDGIVIRTSLDGERLAVEIEPAGNFERTGRDGEGVGRWELIKALFPDAALEDQGGSPVLRLAAPIG
jgi:anti-sigma regulatory factor (Ser/Thr protein kinase)